MYVDGSGTQIADGPRKAVLLQVSLLYVNQLDLTNVPTYQCSFHFANDTDCCAGTSDGNQPSCHSVTTGDAQVKSINYTCVEEPPQVRIKSITCYTRPTPSSPATSFVVVSLRSESIMAKGSRRFRPFDKRSRFPLDDRHYLDGDWKLNAVTKFLGLGTGDGRSINEEVNHECKDDKCSVSSFSTNATTDNNIGPGRILDKLYQYLGRKVEWGILHVSVSSLHPNRIMHCLCVDEVYDDDDSDSDSDADILFEFEPPSPPIRSQTVELIDLNEVIVCIHEQRGSAAVAGLKSLFHQMQ